MSFTGNPAIDMALLAASGFTAHVQYHDTLAATAASAPSVVNRSNNVENEDPDDTVMPWEEDGWVPRTASGKQKSPNQIRNELQ